MWKVRLRDVDDIHRLVYLVHGNDQQPGIVCSSSLQQFCLGRIAIEHLVAKTAQQFDLAGAVIQNGQLVAL